MVGVQVFEQAAEMAKGEKVYSPYRAAYEVRWEGEVGGCGGRVRWEGEHAKVWRPLSPLRQPLLLQVVLGLLRVSLLSHRGDFKRKESRFGRTILN